MAPFKSRGGKAIRGLGRSKILRGKARMRAKRLRKGKRDVMVPVDSEEPGSVASHGNVEQASGHPTRVAMGDVARLTVQAKRLRKRKRNVVVPPVDSEEPGSVASHGIVEGASSHSTLVDVVTTASRRKTRRGQDSVSGMEQWQQLGTPPTVIRALKELGFTSPTPIQLEAIPAAMRSGCDVIGAAETGSGKTLAFAIPILHYILKHCKLVHTGKRRQRIEGEKRTGGKVIDLNEVVYLSSGGDTREESEEEGVKEEEEGGMEEKEEEDEDEEEEEEEGEQEDDGEGEEEREEEEEEDEDEEEEEGQEEEEEEKKNQEGLGLVTYRDCIPDEEFQKMLEQPCVTESADVPGGEGMTALILTPTRELALQVHCHIKAAAKYTGIQVCVVVGGMATEKQERLLSYRPAIVVATPGRLWKLMSEGNSHLCALDELRFLVLDEADRMVEQGHYQELGLILDRVNGSQTASTRQTLVFSATLTLTRRSTERKRRKKRTITKEESMDNLMTRVGLKENATVVDLSRARGTVHTLTETRIMCTAPEKDTYLYCFLLIYPGRTLVFVNSIDCLQRLRALLELLGVRALPLHAHMQQRQRLKNLDRFVADDRAIVIATDVAARGLDVPNVQHVIHYQVPRNSELYVHRSGRTARAEMEGLSVVLVGPEDLKAYRNICKTLNRDEELASFPMESSYLPAIRRRVSLARQIDSAQLLQRRARKSNDWLLRSAKAMDIEVDEDMLVDEEAERGGGRVRGKEAEERVGVLKAELAALLRKPILPCSVSMTFPTRDKNHKILAGVQRSAKHKKGVITAGDTDALSVAKNKVARQ